MYQAFADAVLVLHAALVAFVIGGLVVIWFGHWRRWRWVNSWWFRLTHLAVIGVVVAQAWLGQTCPLTALESWLRGQAGEPGHGAGFIEYWVSRMLFYAAPGWVFTLGYTAFGALVVVTWWCFPPNAPQRPDTTAGARENIMQSGEGH
jgi:Protein of Unknown function (DUF2784)